MSPSQSVLHRRFHSVRFDLLLQVARVTRVRPDVADRLRLSNRLRLALADSSRKSGRSALLRMPVMGVDMDLDPNEYMQGTAIVSGVYERNEVLAFLRLVSPGDTVVDIGANIGQFSLLAAAAVGPTGRVHSFEPLPSTFRRLQSHVVGGPYRETVRLWNVGLGEADEELTLWGSSELEIHGARNDGLTSAFPDQFRSKVVGSMSVRRWDDLVGGRIDAIKVDCEGSELTALRGMTGSIAEFRPRLLIEMNPATFVAAGYDSEDVLVFLETFGYSFFRVGNRGVLTPLDRKADTGQAWTLVALPDPTPASATTAASAVERSDLTGP